MVDMRRWTNSVPANKPVVLAMDVGGSNTNVALALTGKAPVILVSWHYATRELSSLEPPIKVALDFAHDHKLVVKSGCIAAAGPVVKGSVQGPNIPFKIDGAALSKKVKVSMSLVNDFEAIAKGIEVLPDKDIFVVQKGVVQKDAVRVVIGAGSGLGKSIMVFDEKTKAYRALPSEGGHGDFPFYPSEFDMCRYFGKNGRAPDQEFMVSGKGIEAIYTFLRPMAMSNRMVDEIDQAQDKAKLISKYYRKDKLCRDTLDMFAKFCARVARNFALDTLSFGGVFIAGGIAAKNKQIFSKAFLDEFLNVDERFSRLLKSMPLVVVTNYDVSLYGAAVCAR